MIIVETVTIRNKKFTHTYSDAGFMIERDGIRYSDAFDLPELGYTYIETDEMIEVSEEDEATIADY